MIDYQIRRISCTDAKKYIIKNHYSHGCHNGPFPCYGLYKDSGVKHGLFDTFVLIGVLMFATPCSENVRASVWGEEFKDRVIELHRLHIKDGTPKNTESWFISRCLKMLKEDAPQIRGIISFADETEGHSGIIYQATNFYYIGRTSESIFYKDNNDRLRHPHQSGVNITKEKALEKGWEPVKRLSKYRYLMIIAPDRRELKKLKRTCLYDILHKSWCRNCGCEIPKNEKFCSKCKEEINVNESNT